MIQHSPHQDTVDCLCDDCRARRDPFRDFCPVPDSDGCWLSRLAVTDSPATSTFTFGVFDVNARGKNASHIMTNDDAHRLVRWFVAHGVTP